MSELKSQLDAIHDTLEKLCTYQDNVLLDLSSVSRADLESYVQSQYFKMPIDKSGTMFDAIEMHKVKMKALSDQETSLRLKKYELESKLRRELDRR
jgi:hypothetical protein